jgi:hypothetical protein
MKFKHAIDAVDDYDRTQISYADIEVTISVEEITNSIKQLNRTKLYELRDRVLALCREPTSGSSESITITSHGEMAVNMDYLVEHMEFDAYLYAHHKEMRHLVLSRPNYLAAEMDFLEGVMALREKIKTLHHEDILSGDL